MVITYVGGYCFKLVAGDTVVAVNPPSASSRHKVAKFGADVALIPTAHTDWNGEETTTHGDTEAFVIRGPGAYEVGEVVVTGFPSEGSVSGEISEYGNTVYFIEFDGMKILSLGALSSAKLSQEIRSNIDEVDIVLAPIGGATLDPKEAHELVVSLEPHVTIPFAVNGAEDFALFLKTAGAHNVKPSDKFTIRQKEIALMEGEIVVLT